MTEVTRHRLTDRDTATLTANCSVCGFVAIRKAGNGFQCAVKKAETHRAWAKANPAKVSANRQSRSEHNLSARDYKRLLAWCSKCESTVDLTMWGSGYTCGVRARELRSLQQETLAGQWCRECQIIDGAKVRLRADGCPRCNDPRLSDLGASTKDTEHNMRHGYRDAVPAGFHVERESFDPYGDLGYESAVQGWKTIGSERRWDEV